VHLANSKSHERQEASYLFDTIATSIILANILNPERVQSLLSKRNVSLDYYRTLVFPVVDISKAGSLHLIKVDTLQRSVTVVRSLQSTMSTKVGLQFADLMKDLIPGDQEWTLKEHEEVGTLDYSNGTIQVCQRFERYIST
jgi:hypothetical protein